MTVGLTAAALPISAGNVGEVIQGQVLRASAVSLTSTTAANVTSVALTAGIWQISGAIAFVPAASTSVTVASFAVSATTAALPATSTTAAPSTAGEVLMTNNTAANVYGGDFSVALPSYQVTLAAASTLYLVASSTFSVSTNKACGTLTAVRVQ